MQSAQIWQLCQGKAPPCTVRSSKSPAGEESLGGLHVEHVVLLGIFYLFPLPSPRRLTLQLTVWAFVWLELMQCHHHSKKEEFAAALLRSMP